MLLGLQSLRLRVLRATEYRLTTRRYMIENIQHITIASLQRLRRDGINNELVSFGGSHTVSHGSCVLVIEHRVDLRASFPVRRGSLLIWIGHLEVSKILVEV